MYLIITEANLQYIYRKRQRINQNLCTLRNIRKLILEAEENCSEIEVNIQKNEKQEGAHICGQN